eukprot:CAMPEP_0172487770 /NCGR_PEP_ID=MMETSP1066-20121228/16989_1 /TAXON_ID=671091 /ORGANISM="Coscinodiscus wailesii, Strain CCMP2513" /LENGTH=355 /DNA_ID=CAMNT_0013254585 /DNA_START=51 /DNA_END=1118 /DNA_ORIENTATION=-
MTTFNDRHLVVGFCAVFGIISVAFFTRIGKPLPSSPLQRSSSLPSNRTGNRLERNSYGKYSPTHTDLPEIPKLIHFTIGDDAPPHQMRVIEYSMKTAKDTGFEVMLHRDRDIYDLIRSDYSAYLVIWEMLNGGDGVEKGVRISNFARLLLLYHYGGIYLDGDMVICQDLTELVEEPGIATFPQVQSIHGHIYNSVMSAPPRHRVFEIALNELSIDDNLLSRHIIAATGSELIARSVDKYFEVTETTPIALISKREELPMSKDESKWVQSGLIRFGVVHRRKGQDHTRGAGTIKTLGLVHLHWKSWRKDYIGKHSNCETDLDLIEPFLDLACMNVEQRGHLDWYECGINKDKLQGA